MFITFIEFPSYFVLNFIDRYLLFVFLYCHTNASEHTISSFK